jgi:hypothetical protein
MKVDDVTRLEALIRDVNPVPDAGVLIGSEESAAVTLVLSRAAEMDVPGLLPALPDSLLHPSPDDGTERLERGRTLDTLERTSQQETRPPERRRAAAIAFAAVVLVAAVIGVASLLIDDNEAEVASPGPAALPEITFVDPERDLFTDELTVRQLIEDTYVKVEPLLDVAGISFAVSHEIYGLPIQEYGVNYSMADANTVVLAIDPYLPQLGEVLPERLPVMVAEALYHVARERSGLEVETFLDTMVLSGLADHFAEEVLGSPPPPWTNAFPVERTDEFIERAQPLLDTRWADQWNPELSNTENWTVGRIFDDWFYVGSAEIPHWAGPTLGYRLVESYQAENPGQTAADLVNAPASVFRP